MLTLHRYEFRGFVHEGNLNALTQISYSPITSPYFDSSYYYKACYVAEMAPRKNEIEQKIMNLFQTLQPIIATIRPPINSYVIDFAFDENFEHVSNIVNACCFY